MITIITNVIIVQIDKFLKNSFILLFVDKKLGKIKINTAIRKNCRHYLISAHLIKNFSKIF